MRTEISNASSELGIVLVFSQYVIFNFYTYFNLHCYCTLGVCVYAHGIKAHVWVEVRGIYLVSGAVTLPLVPQAGSPSH